MTPAEFKLRKARTHIVQLHPFYGALLLKQKLEETDAVESMATNGKTLKYNPQWVLDTPNPHLDFVCAHEALHPGLGHHVRRGNRELDRWNRACDYAINPILIDSGLEPPDGILNRDDLKGKSAEEVFKILTEEETPDEPPPPEDVPDVDDDDTGDDEPDEPDDDTGDDTGDESEGDDNDTPDDSNDDTGDDDATGDAPTPDYGGTGAIEDAEFDDDAKRNAEENEWRVALTQAANIAAASEGGELPGDLQRQIKSLLEPKANWRELLRRFMDQFAKADYTFETPNRRFIAKGLYLPSMKSIQLPPIAFVVDASGSMPDKALEQAGSEVQAIIDELRPEYVDVIIHDTEVREVRHFEPDDEIDFHTSSGGGTKFGPVCEYLDNADEPYAVVVWFTDLCAWDWDELIEPLSPIVFIDYSSRNESRALFGEYVALDED